MNCVTKWSNLDEEYIWHRPAFGKHRIRKAMIESVAVFHSHLTSTQHSYGNIVTKNRVKLTVYI